MVINEQAVREHVERCPFGWWDGRVVIPRKTTDEDVIQWIHQLRVLVGIERDIPAQESGR